MQLAAFASHDASVVMQMAIEKTREETAGSWIAGEAMELAAESLWSPQGILRIAVGDAPGPG